MKFDEAKELVDKVSSEYLSLSFDEIKQRLEASDGYEECTEWADGEEVTFSINMGFLHAKKRDAISVEIFIDFSKSKMWIKPCLYFEINSTGEIERYD